MQDVVIGQHSVGDGHPTVIVAEMAWSHDGSVDHATTIINAAADAGAHLINLHVTSLPDYMTRDYGAAKPGQLSTYEMLERLCLTPDDWVALVRHARDRGLLVSVMANDFPSLQLAVESLHADLLMIHPSCITEEKFVRAVAAHGRPVLLYVGALTLNEIERTIALCHEAGNTQIILQHGFQAYPTPLEDNRLASIRTLKQAFHVPVAFGDHTDGGDPMALIVPLLGIAQGANLVEKHLTHDRSRQGVDYQSALDPEDFKRFVALVHQAQPCLGGGHAQPLSQREAEYRTLVRKRAVAARAIKAGDVLTMDAITFKRANDGAYADELERLLGRILTIPLDADDPITDTCVQAAASSPSVK